MLKLNQKLNELKMNEFAIKYCRILLYLTLFCCFLFSTFPVTAYSQNQVNYMLNTVTGYNPTVGDGSESSPFEVPYSYNGNPIYAVSVGDGNCGPPTIGWVIFTSAAASCGFSQMYSPSGSGTDWITPAGGNKAYFHVNGSWYPGWVPDIPVVQPTYSLIPNPWGNMTPPENITYPGLNWTNGTPALIPTLPPNIGYLNVTNKTDLINNVLNETLLPMDQVNYFLNMIDFLFNSIRGIVDLFMGILNIPINFIVNLISTIVNYLNQSVQNIIYYLVPIASIMQIIFYILPPGILSLILLILCLDLVWVLLHGRKD